MLLLCKARHQVVVLILVVRILIPVLRVVGLDARRRTKPKLSDKGSSDLALCSDRKLQLEVPCAFALYSGPESSESETKSIRFILTYLR